MTIELAVIGKIAGTLIFIGIIVAGVVQTWSKKGKDGESKSNTSTEQPKQ